MGLPTISLGGRSLRTLTAKVGTSSLLPTQGIPPAKILGRTNPDEYVGFSSSFSGCSLGQGRQALDNLDRFQADGDDLGDQAYDVRGIVRAVGVVGDAAAFVGADLVLVNDPFEGGTVAAVRGREHEPGLRS